jgi:hypothetical protein
MTGVERAGVTRGGNMATMKLSEAIRMNGMMKPQGFGGISIADPDAPCALGGALQSVGRQLPFVSEPNYNFVRDIWPFLDEERDCPECGYTGHPMYVIIYHLNDVHRWTRAQIADWVELHEPLDDAASVSAEFAAERSWVRCKQI